MSISSTIGYMETEYSPRLGLSDAKIAAINYHAAQVDNTGFRMGMYEPDNTIDGVLIRGTYEIGDNHMRIYDPVWGEEYIGDEPYDSLFIELARTPIFRRLQSIEQLTLGRDHATMPNSMYFSRWEHIWGSLVFVRKMTEGRDDIDPKQRAVLQLRTLLSDVGHTAFSHLGDWMFQGPSSSEDLHDQDLRDLLAVTGIGDMLAKYEITLDEAVFPDIEDWVECPSPDLCVDRVDYGFREMLRWAAPTIPLHMHLQELHDPQRLFEITPQGQLAMKNPLVARYYAAGFSLLPTEHWSHPVHRLQLQLFQSGVRSAVIDKSEYDGMHPRDVLYGIDNDFMAHLQTWPMLQLQKTMRDIAVTQRKIFVGGRRADLNEIFRGIDNLDWEFPEYPDPLASYTWNSAQFSKPYPPNVEIAEVDGFDGKAISWNDKGLVVSLPPLKPRAVDPLVIVKGSVVPQRLSAIEPSYVAYLQGQRDMMARSYRAVVLMRPDVAKLIVDEHEKADAVWPELLRRSRSAENLSRIIREVMPFAAASSFDTIREVYDRDIARVRQLGSQGVLFGL